MKSNEILKAIGLPKSKYNNAHCSKLASVYSLLKEVKGDIISAEIVGSEELFFGRDTENSYDWKRGKEIKVNNEGQSIKAEKIKVVTSYGGVYSFAIPIENAFYYAVLDLLGISYKDTKVEITEFKMGVILVPEILDDIKRAAKFVSKNDLKPQLGCVCLDFSGECVQVVATDAHRLYLSRKRGYERNDKTPFKILISAESVKELCSVKVDYESPITIKVVDKETAYFNDIKVSLYDGYQKFPDYKAVIPTYDTSMVFDRKAMISNVKKVMPYSNKSTMQVNFHLNGKIEMMAEDRDFEFGTTASFPYVSKDFQDTDIAFNGKFLVETLGVFKSSEVSMLHNGIPTKPAIFTDGSERVLVCPLMIKD